MGDTTGRVVDLDGLKTLPVWELLRRLSAAQIGMFATSLISVFLAGFGIGMWTKSLEIPEKINEAVRRETSALMTAHEADQRIATADRRQFQFLQNYLQYMIATDPADKQNDRTQFVQTIRSLYQSQVLQLKKDDYIDKTVGGNPLKEGQVRLLHDNTWTTWVIPQEVQSEAVSATRDLPPEATWHR